MEEKIGIICDMHLTNDMDAPQYMFLEKAVHQMKQDNIKTVICLGDITSFGQLEAWNAYRELVKDFIHYEVAGNADVRDGRTCKHIENMLETVKFEIGGRCVFGLNTAYGKIEEFDRKRLQNIKDGDIVCLHHSLHKLDEDSRNWLVTMAEEKEVTILHGHSHSKFDFFIGKSRVLGFRGLDPDKAVDGPPEVSYLEITDTIVNVVEIPFSVSKEAMNDCSNYFGLSCVDNRSDIKFAMENCINNIELRCNGSDWKPDMELLPALKAWRKKTNGYLSVHMPNLRWKKGMLIGEEKWKQALDFALLIKADGFTMHPPRIRYSDLLQDKMVWETFLKLYVLVAENVPENVKLGIENIHVAENDSFDKNRPFGTIPEDVSLWIDSVNEAVGKMNRVGHVLDVGHARNNGLFAQMYPISRWYSLMGQKTVAYHIHQVVPIEGGLANHRAISNWYGPIINYTSFFECWGNDTLNHVPVFLEVRGSDNYTKSLLAFKEMNCKTKY